MWKRLLDNFIYVRKFEHEQPLTRQAHLQCITILYSSCCAGGFLALFKHLRHELDIRLERLWQKWSKGKPEHVQVRRHVVWVFCMWACHVAINATKNGSTPLEESFVEIITSHTFGQLQPVIKAPTASIQGEAHFLEGLPIPFTLPIVVLLNGLTCKGHAPWFEELHGIELRGVAHTTHAEAREV